MSRRPSWRLALMIPGGIALLAGLDAGLLLMGLPAPITTDRLKVVHGVLLVLGFIATLISLERATALAKPWGYAAPALLGVGGLLLTVTAVPLAVGQSLLVAGSAALVLVYIPLWRRRYDVPLLVQAVAAALAVVAASLWLSGAEMRQVLPWLFGFVILTIAAERVELASITMGARAGRWLLGFAAAAVLALVASAIWWRAGVVALGVVVLALTVWLLLHDVARRTVRATGVTRFMAVCMLAGYAWLIVAGVIMVFGIPTGRPAYDAVAHAVFLGFVMSMIMAHATTILPAVLRIQLPYRPLFWIPFVLLQLALVIRIWFGDGFAHTAAWHLGGVLGVVALLLFLVTAVGSAVAGSPRKSPPAP